MCKKIDSEHKINKMLRQKVQKIFEEIQRSASSHQKYLQLLTDVYKKAPFEEFVSVFLQFLRLTIQHTSDNNKFVQRILTFSSRFCADITRKEEQEDEEHNFLSQVVAGTLEWSCLEMYEMRYNSCYFITMILQDIGEDVQLEYYLIEELQRVMLERLQEAKVAIRLKAMSALVRLQDPSNANCPVINAYLQALTSPNASIRRQALNIAPCTRTIQSIKDRVRDIEPSVRSMAFHKCADIGPKNFKIVDRNLILSCGFKETNASVKETFYDYLLPKWLTSYNGRYLDFLSGLKLVATEEDLETMAYLGKELIKDFYNKHPINDLIAVLPISDEKVIDANNLTNEITLYWKILSELMRESDNMDEQLNQILPELTPFCHYLERLIKARSGEQMDEWKFLEYQFDLLNLLQIAENYDFTDEVGRRTMQSFVSSVLQQQCFSSKVTKILVTLAHKCSSSMDFFSHDMCQLISDIREPLTEEPLSQDQQRERNFKMAELTVKVNILQEQQTEAVEARNYQQAQILDNELENCKKQLEKLQSNSGSEKVRVIKSDVETVCRCLDILIAVLENPTLTKPTPALTTCKEQFLVPLLANENAEVHWRILKCLSLFSLIDKSTAEEYAKIICIPIATYRTIAVTNVLALIQSIRGVTDLTSLYGAKIVGEDEEKDTTSNQSSNRRRLYNNESEDNVISDPKHDNLTLSYIFEIFLDMLDDDRPEIRHNAVLAITVQVKNLFSLTPSMLSRILLKWYSTAKLDVQLQIPLGLLIETYIQMKGSGEVIKEAIIPTLQSIVNAPRTSPLADIDIDNVLLFFAEIMNISLPKESLKILILDMCMKMTENGNERVISLLAKLLCHLDMNKELTDAELIERVESLVEAVKDKVSKRHLEKFLSKLKQVPQTTINTTEKTDTTTENMTVDETENENRIPKIQRLKRRKSRPSKECIVVLERLDLNRENREETILQTIVENDLEEMETDDLNIETPTSVSSNGLGNIISETSDSDFSENTRRSMRLRKKRIV